MRIALTVVLLATFLSAGCGEYDTGRRSAAPEAVGIVVDPSSMGAPVKPAQQQPAQAAPANQPHKIPEHVQSPVGETTEPLPEGMVREEAASGAGKKGQYGPGIIKTPLATYWRAQERITYEAQVKHSLNIYRGMHGNFPKTKEEFEREILKPANIKLPELPAGHRYVYDPEKGELLVERPG